MFIDTHAHLDFADFDRDINKVMERAKEGGILKIINVGCDPISSQKSVEMAVACIPVYAAVGVHPTDCEKYSLGFLDKFFVDPFKAKKIVAIGEIGLDFYRNRSSKQNQIQVFRAQLAFAKKIDLPVIVHSREAEEECLEILKDEDIKKAVFHCYGGSLEIAKKIWKEGYYISVTGNIGYPKSDGVREVVKESPPDKIMFETDSPFLAPQEHRGKRNEPAYVEHIYEKAAEVRGVDLKDLEVLVEQNVRKFFGI